MCCVELGAHIQAFTLKLPEDHGRLTGEHISKYSPFSRQRHSQVHGRLSGVWCVLWWWCVVVVVCCCVVVVCCCCVVVVRVWCVVKLGTLALSLCLSCSLSFLFSFPFFFSRSSSYSCSCSCTYSFSLLLSSLLLTLLFPSRQRTLLKMSSRHGLWLRR